MDLPSTLTPTLILTCDPDTLPLPLEAALSSRGIRVVAPSAPPLVAPSGAARPAVRVTLLTIEPKRGAATVDAVRRARADADAVILVGPSGDDDAVADVVEAWLPLPLTVGGLLPTLRTVAQAVIARRELQATQARLALRDAETRSLYEVGTALSAERDIGRLQDLILRRCRELTSADAGSLYIADERFDPTTGEKRGVLRFEISQNDSMPSSYQRFEIDISERSIAGYVALTGSILNLPDVYALPPGTPFQFNRSIDDATGYRTRSMLVVPLHNHENDIVGLIQLINCKREFAAQLGTAAATDSQVIPFPAEAEQVLGSFAGQAASALNNRLLLDSIERLFEGFVTASVKAIEARDPTTSGHSARVADLTVGIADAINSIGTGRWSEVHFGDQDLRQIRYAGMLHDFGKIGVREYVLLKAKKLSDEQMEVLRLRFDFARKAQEAELSRQQLELLLEHGREAFLERLEALTAEHRAVVERLEHDLAQIALANEPSVLDFACADALTPIRGHFYRDGSGALRPLLEDAEFRALSIQRGSLSDDERRHIESHVQQTYEFLSLMPWTRQLSDVPLIAWAHHEKLDGSGYPQGLRAAEIPIQSRMMTIADIYDALTATDRPYKPALSYDRALDILGEEARQGRIDADLLDVFVARRVYRVTTVGGHLALATSSSAP